MLSNRSTKLLTPALGLAVLFALMLGLAPAPPSTALAPSAATAAPANAAAVVPTTAIGFGGDCEETVYTTFWFQCAEYCFDRNCAMTGYNYSTGACTCDGSGT